MSPTLQDGLNLSVDEKRELLVNLLREKGTEPRLVRASFAQQRLWFLHQLESESSAFNISKAVRMIGPLDVPALENTLRALVARHESLRTNFKLVEGEPVQVILPTCEMEISVVDLRPLMQDER